MGGAGQGLKPIRPWGFPRCGRDTHFALWRHPPPLIPQRRSRPSPVPSFPPSPVARLKPLPLAKPSFQRNQPPFTTGLCISLCFRRSACFAALARSASDSARSIARAPPSPRAYGVATSGRFPSPLRHHHDAEPAAERSRITSVCDKPRASLPFSFFSLPLSLILPIPCHTRRIAQHVLRRGSIHRPQSRRRLCALPQGQDQVRVRKRARALQKLRKRHARVLSALGEHGPSPRPEPSAPYRSASPSARRFAGVRARCL